MNYCLGFKKGRKGETVLRGYTRINIKGKTPINFYVTGTYQFSYDDIGGYIQR